MINNVLNEFSTNDSITLSPSNRNSKEIQVKHQTKIFPNFSSFYSSLIKNQTENIIVSENSNFQKNEKEQKIQSDLNKKIKKRITKRIIKKKAGKSRLLDFDFLIKELFENKNIKNDFSRKEEIYKLAQIESGNKNIIGKKRKKIKKLNSSFSKNKENGKKRNI